VDDELTLKPELGLAIQNRKQWLSRIVNLLEAEFVLNNPVLSDEGFELTKLLQHLVALVENEMLHVLQAQLLALDESEQTT
jgi:hypothetical protein